MAVNKYHQNLQPPAMPLDLMHNICRYSSQEMASITYGVVMASAPVEGTVYGTKGSIKIHDTMHNPKTLSVQLAGEQTFHVHAPLPCPIKHRSNLKADRQHSAV